MIDSLSEALNEALLAFEVVNRRVMDLTQRLSGLLSEIESAKKKLAEKN